MLIMGWMEDYMYWTDWVVIPGVQFEISEEQMEQLRVEVNPIAESSNYGMNMCQF